MKELEITWKRTASVWWLIAWRGFLGGVLIAYALAFLLGDIGGRLGIDFNKLSIAATVIAWVAGLTWGLLVVRMALRKSYNDFRLALLSRT